MVDFLRIFVCLIMLNVELMATDVQIQNVNITGMIPSPYAASGVLVVKFEGTWGNICYYGDRKQWGKREATTACKQLGYKGGWPIMRDEIDRSTHNLHSLDCDQDNVDLNNCEVYTTTNCERSVIAGVQCYNSFKLSLVDGNMPNVGTVQVNYDGVSSDVCFTQRDSHSWAFHNTQVLCRELGYHGAMFDEENSADIENRAGKSLVSGYECKSDLRETSLQECNPDLPMTLSSNADKSTLEDCNGVTVACTMFGYVGCFDDSVMKIDFTSVNVSPEMTINLCRRHCRDIIYRYAILSRGDTCRCAFDILVPVPGNPIEDTRCRMRCSGDNNEVCGDEETSSAYDNVQGVCSIPSDEGTYYFEGELFTLQCKPGTSPANQTSVKCISDGRWNSTEFPKCIEIEMNQQETEESSSQSNEQSKYKLISLTIIPVAVIVVGILLFFYIKWRKNYKRVSQDEQDRSQEGNNGETNRDQSTNNDKERQTTLHRNQYLLNNDYKDVIKHLNNQNKGQPVTPNH